MECTVEWRHIKKLQYRDGWEFKNIHKHENLLSFPIRQNSSINAVPTSCYIQFDWKKALLRVGSEGKE